MVLGCAKLMVNIGSQLMIQRRVGGLIRRATQAPMIVAMMDVALVSVLDYHRLLIPY